MKLNCDESRTLQNAQLERPRLSLLVYLSIAAPYINIKTINSK